MQLYIRPFPPTHPLINSLFGSVAIRSNDTSSRFSHKKLITYELNSIKFLWFIGQVILIPVDVFKNKYVLPLNNYPKKEPILVTSCIPDTFGHIFVHSHFCLKNVYENNNERKSFGQVKYADNNVTSRTDKRTDKRSVIEMQKNKALI